MFDNFDNRNPNIIDLEPSVPKKQNSFGKAAAFILAVTIIGGASGFGGAYLSNTMINNNSVSQTEQQVQSVPTAADEESNTASKSSVEIEKLSDNSTGLSTQEIVKKVTPPVVCVTSTFSTGTGTGTGIIMTDDGYIITNAHVVEEEVTQYNGNGDEFGFGFFGFGNSNAYTKSVQKASKVVVTTSDGKDYDATIVGSDSSSDLAVLKINGTGFTPAEFGDSDALVMGDKAVAIGYPADLGLSTSEGIVSGLDRTISFELATGGTTQMTLIQTDAAINPGNSGGPLVNEYGQVIGITSSKLVDSSIEGLGFAIPITDAMPLINELMDKGYVTNTTPKIGITGTDITPAVQRYYGLPVDSGVVVVSVEANSGAAKAGISEGDVIVAADGKKVKSMDDLVALKNKHKAGETMTVTLARNSGNIDIDIVLDQSDNNG